MLNLSVYSVIFYPKKVVFIKTVKSYPFLTLVVVQVVNL